MDVVQIEGVWWGLQRAEERVVRELTRAQSAKIFPSHDVDVGASSSSSPSAWVAPGGSWW